MLATIPYAATPTFPISSKIIKLKTRITIPEETSVIKEDTPRDATSNHFLNICFVFAKPKLFFPFNVLNIIKIKLIPGAIAVAAIAPNIPSLQGKINT